LIEVYDPQKLLSKQTDNRFFFVQQRRKGSFFVKLRQGNLAWWHAVDVSLLDPVGIDVQAKGDVNYLHLRNYTDKQLAGRIESVGFDENVSFSPATVTRSEEHTSELQSRAN